MLLTLPMFSKKPVSLLAMLLLSALSTKAIGLALHQMIWCHLLKRKEKKGGRVSVRKAKRMVGRANCSNNRLFNSSPPNLLDALPLVLAKEFFNVTYCPQSLMLNGAISNFGKDILTGVDATSNWAIYCDL